MTRILFLLSFFLYFNCHAQSYLGKTGEEIETLVQSRLKEADISRVTDSTGSYLKVINEYETLHYYLDKDVCIKFEVIKPYTCNCLEQDFNAYEENCIPLGKFKWVSKDYSRLYQMDLMQYSYRVSIVPNREELTQLLSSSPSAN